MQNKLTKLELSSAMKCFSYAYRWATGLLVGALLTLFSFNAQPVLAQDSDTVTPSPTATPLPKMGSLGSSFTGGTAGRTANSWGAEVLDKAAAPLGGSVSKSGTTWIAKIFNNSKETYSADVKVVQINSRGGTVRNDYFSITLKPEQSAERSFSLANGAVSADLALSGWKKIGGKKEQPQATIQADPKQANATKPKGAAVVK